MFSLVLIAYNTFCIVKESGKEDKSYGYIKISKFDGFYGVSLNVISDEVYKSGEYHKLEQEAIEIVKSKQG